MPAAHDLSPRRLQLLKAGMDLVAANGLRGLTHRRVDRRAGLPEGSCSSYFRTRHALQGALAAYVAARVTHDVRRLSEAISDHTEESLDFAREATRGLFQDWLGTSSLLIAKLELTMEASRDPELAAVFAESRRELVSVVEENLAVAGRDHSNEHAQALVAALDGVLLGALQRPPEEQSDYLARCLTQLMGPLIGSERGAH
ncbi:MAG: hypothetical protein L0H93_12000 [Nocardioides sp.]|nr:hypothetical protein [Nocardioides sp.]